MDGRFPYLTIQSMITDTDDSSLSNLLHPQRPRELQHLMSIKPLTSLSWFCFSTAAPSCEATRTSFFHSMPPSQTRHLISLLRSQVDPSARLSTYPTTFFRPRRHCCIHTLPPGSCCVFSSSSPPCHSPRGPVPRTHIRSSVSPPTYLPTYLLTYRYLTPWTLGYRHHHHHRHHYHEHQQPPPQTYVQRLQRWLERCHAFRQYVFRYTWLEWCRLVLPYLSK